MVWPYSVCGGTSFFYQLFWFLVVDGRSRVRCDRFSHGDQWPCHLVSDLRVLDLNARPVTDRHQMRTDKRFPLVKIKIHTQTRH